MKIELHYFACSRAAKEHSGEICGYYCTEEFNILKLAKERLENLKQDNSLCISQEKFEEVYEIDDVEIGFRYSDKNGECYYKDNLKNNLDTIKEYLRVEKKFKNGKVKSLSGLKIHKKL